MKIQTTTMEFKIITKQLIPQVFENFIFKLLHKLRIDKETKGKQFITEIMMWIASDSMTQLLNWLFCLYRLQKSTLILQNCQNLCYTMIILPFKSLMKTK